MLNNKILIYYGLKYFLFIKNVAWSNESFVNIGFICIFNMMSPHCIDLNGAENEMRFLEKEGLLVENIVEIEKIFLIS